jgi:hypothetical protein
VTARVLSGVATRILFAKLAVTAVTIQQAAHLLKTLAKAFKRPRSTPPPTHFASAAARIHMPQTAAQHQRDDENTSTPSTFEKLPGLLTVTIVTQKLTRLKLLKNRTRMVSSRGLLQFEENLLIFGN